MGLGIRKGLGRIYARISYLVIIFLTGFDFLVWTMLNYWFLGVHKDLGEGWR